MIGLATPADDPAIRYLLAANPVPGRVTVTFEREPNFFAGCATMGATQTLVARDATNAVVALACRATRDAFVNGAVERIGYLGVLRVDRRHRGRWLVSQGFRMLQQLHDEDPVAGYLMSIIDGNAEAKGVLVQNRRRHYPVFHALGALCTLALVIGHRRAPLAGPIEVTPASPADIPVLIPFLHSHGRRRQFFPAWQAGDLLEGPATLGLALDDILVARRRGQVVGVSACWDQSSFKQTIVRGYSRWLGLLRPAYNAVAPLLRRPPLPAIGEAIPCSYAALTCVADDDTEAFRALLRALYNLAATRRDHYLMLGLVDGDPLLPHARTYAHIAYPSQLFLAEWTEGLHARLDGRIPYLDIAAL